MSTPENTFQSSTMTKKEFVRYLANYTIKSSDPVLLIPAVLVVQEAQDILAGKSTCISFNVVKMIQDTIISIDTNSPETGPRAEQARKRIDKLAHLQEAIYEGELQERPAFKNKQQPATYPDNASDDYPDTNLQKDFSPNS